MLIVQTHQVLAPNLLVVVELEELVPAVARHVHQHAALGPRAQPARPGGARRVPAREDAEEVLDGHLVDGETERWK